MHKKKYSFFHSFHQASLSLLCIVVCAINLSAQDPNFTQFYNVPAYANPALVGTANANYRVSTLFRDQWQGALQKPITSFIFGGDLKFGAGGDQKYPDLVGIGIMFLNDKVGQFDFTTNQVAVSGSYHKLLDRATLQYLGIGIQSSIQSKSLGYANVNFGDQFNAVDGFTLETSEDLPVNNIGIFDFSMGINYSITPNDDQQFSAGLAAFHIFRPDISFYSQDELLNRRYNSSSILPLRWTAHANFKQTINPRMASETRGVYNKQDFFQEINLNQLFSFTNPLFAEKSFFVGPGIRASNFQDKSNLRFESLNLTAGVQLNKMVMSASFEHALSPLVANRRNFNSFELSFILFGNYDNDVDICPKF